MAADEIAKRFADAAALQNTGQLQAASDAYQAILATAPGHAPSLHRLGVIAHLVGQDAIAATLIERAIANDATIAAYWTDLGEMYRRLGRKQEAETAFRRALTIDPALGSAANNLAILLHGAGRFDEAIRHYRRAVAALPGAYETRMNLGMALLATGAVGDAVQALERAVELAPAEPAAWLNLGNGRMAEDRLEAAVAAYERALTQRPNYAQAALNLGRARRELGDPEAALGHYEQAAAMAPELAAARWNAGSCRLLLGDYRAGWPGFAERWRAGAVPPHGLTSPEWHSEVLAGKRLLVHAEQGLGDTIQFLRFMPMLASAGAVVLQCQPPLQRLLAANGYPVVTAVPPHDFRIPLLDLPGRFDVTLDTLPQTPYLAADPKLLAGWRDRIGDGGGKRIGLAWQGRRDHANDRQRSMPFAALAPLLELGRISWFSLQLDHHETLPPTVTDLTPDLHDLADTAAAIMALDAVVAVDTAIAHLAGALGRPVHLLLPFAPDWRWLTDRTDSPWYPSIKLYRQSIRGDWSRPIGRLATVLAGDPI